MQEASGGAGLQGKVALITGASRGLGRAMALALGSAGATIALVARGREGLVEVARLVRDAGGHAAEFPADVSDEDQVQRLEQKISAEFGRVNILINNAGITQRKPLADFALAEWRRVLDTNLTSVFLMCRAFVPHLRDNGYGRILNLSSVMSLVGLPGRAVYCASKAGVIGLTRALALELAPHGITVNAISPGTFATEMNRPLTENPEVRSFFLSRIPAGRFGRVEEIGELALFLCSEQAGFITGAEILIDGGWRAQ
jgi:NAD(P)-dependent dehydrogenase (short-subunit alcohol dehydrogenase family)